MTQSIDITPELEGQPPVHLDALFWLAVACGLLVASGIRAFVPATALPTEDLTIQLLVSSVVLYPLLEELVFRGALQGWLFSHPLGRVSWCGISVANLATTFVFTSLHFSSHEALWAASVLVPSLVFGFFRDRHRSLYPGIALHAFYNLSFVLVVVPG